MTKKVPIVFISYASEELILADFVKKVLLRLSNSKLEAFVATRDIRSGENPLKIMLEEKLKNAQAIIPICSQKAKDSSWVWWESSSVWARGYKVYPLCTNISLGHFGPPLNLVTQGKNLFEPQDLSSTLQVICEQFGLDNSFQLLKNEIQELMILKEEYSKLTLSAKIVATYKPLDFGGGKLHKYSFFFDIENTSGEQFKNVVVELLFPIEYLEKKKWEYQHLHSSQDRHSPEFLNLTFDYSAMPEQAQREYSKFLLPGKKIRIFGEEGIAQLHYFMDMDRWKDRFESNFQVTWKVFINGKAPQEGSIPFNSLNQF